MPETGRFDQIVDKVVANLAELRTRLPDKDVIPFGQERVTKREARKRLEKMTRGGRERLVQQIGLDKVMELLS